MKLKRNPFMFSAIIPFGNEGFEQRLIFSNKPDRQDAKSLVEGIVKTHRSFCEEQHIISWWECVLNAINEIDDNDWDKYLTEKKIEV
jgi:hypothetical protein